MPSTGATGSNRLRRKEQITVKRKRPNSIYIKYNVKGVRRRRPISRNQKTSLKQEEYEISTFDINYSYHKV